MHFELKRVQFTVNRKHIEVVKFVLTGSLNGLLTMVWKVKDHWLSAIALQYCKGRKVLL